MESNDNEENSQDITSQDCTVDDNAKYDNSILKIQCFFRRKIAQKTYNKLYFQYYLQETEKLEKIAEKQCEEGDLLVKRAQLEKKLEETLYLLKEESRDRDKAARVIQFRWRYYKVAGKNSKPRRKRTKSIPKAPKMKDIPMVNIPDLFPYRQEELINNASVIGDTPENYFFPLQTYVMPRKDFEIVVDALEDFDVYSMKYDISCLLRESNIRMVDQLTRKAKLLEEAEYLDDLIQKLLKNFPKKK